MPSAQYLNSNLRHIDWLPGSTMAAPFGFSVGDLIAACRVLHTGMKAVVHTHQAEAEYQSTIADLEFFQLVIQNFTTLQNTHSDDEDSRHYAEHCCRPISKFLEKIRKYEKALVPQTGRARSPKTLLFKAPRQLKWALYVKENAEKVRKEVEPRFCALILRLTLPARRDVVQTKETLQVISKSVNKLEVTSDMVFSIVEEIMVHTEPHSTKIVARRRQDADLQVESVPRFRITIGSVEITKPETLELLIVILILVYSPSLPGTHRLIWQIIVSALLAKRCLPRPPTTLLDTNIHLTDALGRLLNIAFDDCPERMNVRSQNFGFLLLDKGQRRILDFMTWTKEIYPGAKVAMVMLVLGIGREIGECPRCGTTSHKTDRFGWSTCRDCALVHRLDNREFMTAEEQLALTDELDHGEEGYLDDIEWNVDGNADHREGDKDVAAFKIVQWFTEPCDRCSAIFISIPKLIEHLHHVHGDQRYEVGTTQNLDHVRSEK
ncbi:hypothetical protein M409DRAFT_22523 [Zasmidium cellare ATCC 36951]|uniref:C2H2-type domain-containing protein n=1 Tax=Zasmidium cellare ATCC 36951 TaxID=1080233 RepID=A0A6A6CMW4_ZASCE|nr:uncharacterized protein M409DRAFT_22523 [Zasmidium cellare ATCC 36951]KAF2167089.1 hypothetical protein M409DRAFT_22523 [Zasmidium cellare ATCC 36951]